MGTIARFRFFRFEFFHPASKGGLRFQRRDGARTGLSVNVGRHVYGVDWSALGSRQRNRLTSRPLNLFQAGKSSEEP